MTIFEYNDYKTYVRERVQNMPKRGRGEFQKIAKALGVSTTVVSHVFKGERHISVEQGLSLAQYLGLSDLETRYLLALISKERAGTHQLKAYYEAELKQLSEQSQMVKNRLLKKIDTISDEIQAQYFSDWMYVACQLLTALPACDNIDAISTYFNISRERVQKVVGFLVQNGLLIEENGRLAVGHINVHLPEKSQVINSHRRNWRVKSLERINEPAPTDLFYSFITTITDADRELIKSELIDTISRINKRAYDSEPKRLFCMNIDWFEVK